MKRITLSWRGVLLLLAVTTLAGCTQSGEEGGNVAQFDGVSTSVRPEPTLVQGEEVFLISADVQQSAVPMGSVVFLDNGTSFSITEASLAHDGLRAFSLEIVNGTGDPIDDTMIPVPALIDTVSGEEQPAYRDSVASIGSDFIGPIDPGEYADFSLAYRAPDDGREFGVRVSLPSGQAVIFEYQDR